MKQIYAKVLASVLCLFIVMCTVILVRADAPAAEPDIILYYNDRQWALSDAEKNTSGVYYVPLTIFAQLPSVSVRINKTLQTFIVTHGDLYLSFDTATNFAANQDKIRTPIKTYEKNDERYVPAAIVCAYLDLSYEEIKSPTTGAVAVRITDGSEQYSLSTLLRRRNPGFYPATSESHEETTVAPPVTAPPSLDDRIVYITIENCPGEYTDDILDVLDKYGYKATFFITGDKVLSHVSILSRIMCDGHAVALGGMHGSESKFDSTSQILDDINTQNELLFKLIKQKSRIWRMPAGAGNADISNHSIQTALHGAGYVIWDANVNIPTSYGSRSAASAAINGIRSNEISVLRFTESASTAETLKRLFDFISDNSEACEVRIISAALDSKKQ